MQKENLLFYDILELTFKLSTAILFLYTCGEMLVMKGLENTNGLGIYGVIMIGYIVYPYIEKRIK